MARCRAHKTQEDAHSDVENSAFELERERVKEGAGLGKVTGRGWKAGFGKEHGHDDEEQRRPKTVEELEFERQGGYSRFRQEEAIQYWTCLLWFGHALPEAILLILIPILAAAPSRDGFRFYQTLNFNWACSTLVGVFLTSQLTACYLRCIVVSARCLEPERAAAVQYDPRGHVPSPEAMAAAVERVTCPSRLEVVLAVLFLLLKVETNATWLLGTLHGQSLVGQPFGFSLWLQLVLSVSFMSFVIVVYPFIFRALRVGILRREKARSIDYVCSRMHTVVPVLLLQVYVIVYIFLTIALVTPPVSLSMLYYSGSNRAFVCGSLSNPNCTLTYDPADSSADVRFTAYRPDAVSCVGEGAVAGYGSRYSACVAALIGDDLVFRALCGICASLTAVMTLISVELLQLIPVAVDQILHPKHFLRRFSQTGISCAVKLVILILYCELLCCLAYLVLLAWAGVGQKLYDYFNWFLLLFGLPKVLVASLLLTEFMQRRFTDTSSDMYTTRLDGQVAPHPLSLTSSPVSAQAVRTRSSHPPGVFAAGRHLLMYSRCSWSFHGIYASGPPFFPTESEQVVNALPFFLAPCIRAGGQHPRRGLPADGADRGRQPRPWGEPVRVRGAAAGDGQAARRGAGY